MPARSATIDRSDSRRRLIVAVATFLLVSFLVIRTSDAAFTASHVNEDNAFTTASIDLTSPVGIPMFGEGLPQSLTDATNLIPGDSVSACIDIVYEGTIDANLSSVEFAVSGATGDLADALDVTVQLVDSCTAGNVESTLVNGSALSAIAATDSGWTPDSDEDSRGFRFSVEFDDDGLQGEDLSGVDVTWSLATS